MTFIRQRNKKDCGVAAIAMLCDATYEDADRAIPWRREGNLEGTTTKQLREAAAKLGYEGRGTQRDRLKLISAPPGWPKKIDHTIWSLIPDNSLVKLPQLLGARGWHWVTWRKGKIYDPARGVFKPEKYGDHYPSSYMHFVPEGTEDCPECGTPTEAQQSGIKCPSCGWTYCI